MSVPTRWPASSRIIWRIRRILRNNRVFEVVSDRVVEVADYHTVELIFDGNKILYKDWWDPGHDPNRAEVTIDRFLKGELHDAITRELGSRVLEEALETVECLTSGGPGVAEPPD